MTNFLNLQTFRGIFPSETEVIATIGCQNNKLNTYCILSEIRQLVKPSFVKSLGKSINIFTDIKFESNFSKSSGGPTITLGTVPCEERLTHSPRCNYVSQASPFDPPTPSPPICIYIRLIINNHVMRSHVLVMSSSQLVASSKQMRYITCYLLQLKFWFSF